jgi:Uma2 family endonuclease
MVLFTYSRPMKSAIPEGPPGILDWRKTTGADRWDEMWGGVVHMAPMPNREHQDLEWALETYLRLRWSPTRGGRVYHNINVARAGAWPNDYRIPDLVLLTPERFPIDRNEYFEGAPDVAVEIRSPGDESFEKLEFYARIGVPEVWIVDRDSKVPEIHLLVDGRYVPQTVDADGWLSSRMGVELKAGSAGKLAVRLTADEITRQDLP